MTIQITEDIHRAAGGGKRRRAPSHRVGACLATAGLAAGMMIGAAAPAAAETAGDITYSIIAGSATVTGRAGPNQSIVIPRYVPGAFPDSLTKVTAIADGAFAYQWLTSVVIPNTVTTIGAQAFNTNSLGSVVIPHSVTQIGAAAFIASGLTSVVIPGSLETIQGQTFSGNELTSVTIPNGVKYIRNDAFSNNPLSSVVIAGSVREINDSAFSTSHVNGQPVPLTVSLLGDAPTVLGFSALGKPASQTHVFFRADAAGYTIDAAGYWRGYPATALQPAAAVGSPSIRQGGSTTISGGTVFPGEKVTAALGTTVIGSGTALDKGQFAFTITLPADTPVGPQTVLLSSPFGTTTLTQNIPIVVMEKAAEPASPPESQPGPAPQPQQPQGLSRKAAAKMLYQLGHPGKTPKKCTAKPFTDVAKGNALCRYIRWAKTSKTLRAVTAGQFKPNAAITRAQLAEALYRVTHGGKAAAKCLKKPFRDVAKNSASCGAITWAAAKKVMPPAPNKKFRPNGAVTAKQATAMLKAAQKYLT